MNLKKENFSFSFSNLKKIIILLLKNKSPLRIFHNIFLQNIELSGKTIDLGSGNHSSYLNYLNNKSKIIYFADKVEKNQENYFQVDLEKKLNFNDSEFDNVILFNVIEHVQNYQNLIDEIHRIIKINGKLELFVPFMFRYHPDPNDYFRPTHYYLNQLLTKTGFDVKIHLIGVGPILVVQEIISKYLKFRLLKIFFFPLFLVLDRIIQIFSKDHSNYYCGFHCTCIKKSEKN